MHPGPTYGGYYFLEATGNENEFRIASSYNLLSATFTASDTDVTPGAFSTGENMFVRDPATDDVVASVPYLGQYDGGIVSVSFGYIWFTDQQFTDEEIAAGVTFTMSTADFLVCFLPGTLIATPGGETAVETLSIGDLVLTADGRAVPVRWIGRQTVVTLFGPPESRAPVVIEAGALAEGLPHADLRLTADHALILDGIAVNAGALVNGTTIRRIPRAELGPRFTVFHVETANHEVILANGAPAETFVDHVSRASFDNHAEYLALHGEERPVEEMELPRATSARQVPAAIRARLAARAAALRRRTRAA